MTKESVLIDVRLSINGSRSLLTVDHPYILMMVLCSVSEDQRNNSINKCQIEISVVTLLLNLVCDVRSLLVVKLSIDYQ